MDSQQVALTVGPLVALMSFTVAFLGLRHTVWKDRRSANESGPALTVLLTTVVCEISESTRLYRAALLLTNRSSTASTIQAAVWIVQYATTSSSNEVQLELEAVSANQVPVRLDGRDSQALEFQYSCPRASLQGKLIRGYRLDISDLQGAMTTFQLPFVQERMASE
jgi:hypothetical protein